MNTDQKATVNDTTAKTENIGSEAAASAQNSRDEHTELSGEEAPDVACETEAEQDEMMKAFETDMDALRAKYPKVQHIIIASITNKETKRTSSMIVQSGYTGQLARPLDGYLQQNKSMMKHLALIGLERKLMGE